MMVVSGKKQGRSEVVMDRMIRVAALTGFVALTAATAHAQGLLTNYGSFGGPDPASPPFQAKTNSYSGFYLGPDGSLQSGTVNAFSMNLGHGVSMGLLTGVSNAPGLGFSGFGGNGFVQSFPGSVPTDFINRQYLDSTASMRTDVAGQMSIGLGGGFSMNVLGGVSRGPSSGFYFGPGNAFDNRTFTTVGTGFSFNFGRGGTVSLTGSVSSGPRFYGAGFP
jgi:hypothetical protein